MPDTVTITLKPEQLAQAANALNEYANRLERMKPEMDPGMRLATESEIYRARQLHADFVREIDRAFRSYRGPTVENHLTSDPDDPRLTRGVDDHPVPQAKVYLTLSDAERAKGFVRPVRRTYVHNACGTATTMGQPLAETYARDPHFYGATYCVTCRMHLPVDEFVWEDGFVVGS